MDPIASCVEHVLRDQPHPALRLTELLELVAERTDRTLDIPRLRAALEAYPARFKILDPWQGPWRSIASEDARVPGDVWVAATGSPDGPGGGAASPGLKLRESVRWLATGVDPRSPGEVSRWYAIAMSERAARKAISRPAA